MVMMCPLSMPVYYCCVSTSSGQLRVSGDCGPWPQVVQSINCVVSNKTCLVCVFLHGYCVNCLATQCRRTALIIYSRWTILHAVKSAARGHTGMGREGMGGRGAGSKEQEAGRREMGGGKPQQCRA